jgi:hypothetical protein
MTDLRTTLDPEHLDELLLLRSQFKTKQSCWMYGMNNIPFDVYDPVLFDDQTFWL